MWVKCEHVPLAERIFPSVDDKINRRFQPIVVCGKEIIARIPPVERVVQRILIGVCEVGNNTVDDELGERASTRGSVKSSLGDCGRFWASNLRYGNVLELIITL